MTGIQEMPFNNLLEYTKYFINLKDNIVELCNFCSKKEIYVNGLKCDYLIYNLMVRIFRVNKKENDLWFQFSDEELNKLLEDPFFDGYKINDTNSKLKKCFFAEKYPLLELYIYYNLQSLSTNYLTYDEADLIAGNWLWNDNIEDIFDLGWYEIIANVYRNFGVHWFCDRKTDPLLYKFAYYAIMSCKKTGSFPVEKIKQDLMQLYSELLISLSIRNAIEDNKDIIDLFADSLVSFDDDKIIKLKETISSLENDKFALIDKNKQLTVGISTLRRQISDLQKSSGYDEEKIENIVWQIYCVSPQNSNYENRYANFRNIWNELSDTTKKDLKLSFAMFEEFDAIDLAIFPLLRSLEHEFVRNFIQPFHKSLYYLKITNFECSKAKYELTHNCLLKKGNEYPTIGSIPFIGRCLDKKEALEASKILDGFSVFLAEKKESFCRICKNIDLYSIGTQNLKLVNIRNGIAHGDVELTNNIDEKCYCDITTMLYEPPVRILFEIIENSKRKDAK